VRYLYVMLGLMLACALCHAQNAGKPLVRICDDGAEWPPYSYYVRKNHEKTTELTGYSVDVIKIILKKNAIPYEIKLLPWKRCLAEVEQGDNYLMALSSSENPEREKLFLFSDPYYTTHYYAFYSKAAYPSGISLHQAADLNHYRLGGVKGYAYSGLPGVNTDEMILTGNYVDLVKMLYATRFDVFAEHYEVIAGLSEIGSYNFLTDPMLGRVAVPGTPENGFHMIFTRNNPAGLQLMTLVNKELAAMKKSGELDRLLSHYIQR